MSLNSLHGYPQIPENRATEYSYDSIIVMPRLSVFGMKLYIIVQLWYTHICDNDSDMIWSSLFSTTDLILGDSRHLINPWLLPLLCTVDYKTKQKLLQYLVKWPSQTIHSGQGQYMTYLTSTSYFPNNPNL